MFELNFVGGLPAGHRRYRRRHAEFETAEAEARRVLNDLDMAGDPAVSRAAHPAIIAGPGCGRDGVTVA